MIIIIHVGVGLKYVGEITSLELIWVEAKRFGGEKKKKPAIQV